MRKLMTDERAADARQAFGEAPDKAPVVSLGRISPDRTWVFGTTAIPAPASTAASPRLAFFAAHWTGSRWTPALSGMPGFAALVRRAPDALMPPGEARALAAFSTGEATVRPGALMLPWKIGGIWTLDTADGGTAPRPLDGLGFSGGDGRVLAAGSGRLYRFCGADDGLLVIVHPDGLATAYDGLRDSTPLRDGSVVQRGDQLGRTGTGRPCGGMPAPHPQVRFGVWHGDRRVPLDGVSLGGWTLRETARPLLGFAERGANQVLSGGSLSNLGPVPAAASPAPTRPASPAPPTDGPTLPLPVPSK
ncbi:hypothetical protein [Actinomadura gamaensis]|uniref:M23 family metallopeptidase n=1 Tax=Actinomadura gamaensis TaxID=1763541 RepID=A0ABV9TWB9_9ACTN